MGRGSGTNRKVVETDTSSPMGLAGNGTVRSGTSPIAEAWHALPGLNLFENCRMMSVEQASPRTASSNIVKCELSEDNPEVQDRLKNQTRTGRQVLEHIPVHSIICTAGAGQGCPKKQGWHGTSRAMR